MENLSDKETVKKKKRRKRKRSSAVAQQTIIKTEKIGDEQKFNTAEIEKIKTEIQDNLEDTRSNPQHMFSVENLFMTVLCTGLVVLTIVGGYLIGVFDSLSAESNKPTDFDSTNSIEMGTGVVTVANYELNVPIGFEVLESNSLLKMTDVITGINVEILELVTEKDLYSEKTINSLNEDLVNEGYIIYGKYVVDEYENKYLVYTGVDCVGAEMRMVYIKHKDVVFKTLVSSEHTTLTDEVYYILDEILKK